MIKHYEILACEIDLNELYFCLQRIEEKLITIEDQYSSSPTLSESSNDELLTRQEVANYFKVNISTIRNWTRQGILKKYGVGDRVYYKRHEVKVVLIEINETNT
jgi:hypothetical protein